MSCRQALYHAAGLSALESFFSWALNLNSFVYPYGQQADSLTESVSLLQEVLYVTTRVERDVLLRDHTKPLKCQICFLNVVTFFHSGCVAYLYICLSRLIEGEYDLSGS